MARHIHPLKVVLVCLVVAQAAFGEVALAQDQAAASSSSPSAPSTPATFRFLAVDHNGNPVTDLRAEDLSVRISNQPRKIVSLNRADSDPRTIGLFFDISGSRRGDNLIPKEVGAVVKFMESNWRPRDVGFVVLFNDAPYTVEKPTSDLPSIVAALQKVPYQRAIGSTALYDALCSVSVVGPQTGRGEKLFIVVGDFEDNSSRKSVREMIETVRQQQIRVFSLFRLEEIDYQRQSHELRVRKIAKNIAEKTGGDVLTVSTEKDLDTAFQRLANELRGAYRLDYEPPPQEPKLEPQIQTARHNVDFLFPRD
ncbi:MAG TPA: VWA domain-containing protein [Candidatus Acidoferrum sp.]|nr:VWA domain-containing protein [Candidatus Acidoferrum sp.]